MFARKKSGSEDAGAE
jgi:hypothetical protein